ncbi:18S rRNA maturation protein [Neopestalotiopsis sp. 37M]|nr:18S rRNA maturation protein [Neopestalotiopsis sp. 37M]
MSFAKRKFNDFQAGPEDGHGESYGNGMGGKRQKNRQGRRTVAPPKNLNDTKRRARNIERALRGAEKLPADKRNDLERELSHLKQKIVDGEEGKKTKKIISKYHMIRFYEKQKADRLAKQLQKQITNTEDEEQLEKLKRHLHVAQIDSLYAKYFPLREKYISLYSSVLKDADGAKTAEEAKAEAKSTNLAAKSLNSERPEFWSVIEKTAEKGEPALMAIRNRKPDSESRSDLAKDSVVKHKKDGKTESKKPSKHKAQAENNDDSGDESDGGFFEAA